MSLLRSKFAALVAASAVLQMPVFAHQDLDETIAELTQQIKASPQDAGTHLQRGELHRLHRDWRAAAADYDRAEILDPNLTEIRVARGRMFLDSGDNKRALIELDAALDAHPIEARHLRGQALMNQGRPSEAAADYWAVIKQSKHPEPDDYLDCARAYSAAGDDARALKVLNTEGAKSGMAIETAALELEMKMSRYKDALKRVDRLTASANRKETWLARRGEILEKQGRTDEAHTAYEAALTALESLPPARRQAEASVRLTETLKSALSRL